MAQADVERPHRLRLITELETRAADPDHPAHDLIAHHHRLAEVFLASTLRKRQAAGLANPDIDPARFARQMAAIWDGLQSRWLVSRDFDLPSAVEDAYRHLEGEHLAQAKRALQQLAAGL